MLGEEGGSKYQQLNTTGTSQYAPFLYRVEHPGDQLAIEWLTDV